MRVGEILDPLITLVVGYQASTDVTIRKVGQCTTVQVQTRRETRVRHVETTKITTASQLYKTFPRVSCRCKTRVTTRMGHPFPPKVKIFLF
jgi:hypothetical protein